MIDYLLELRLSILRNSNLSIDTKLRASKIIWRIVKMLGYKGEKNVR